MRVSTNGVSAKTSLAASTSAARVRRPRAVSSRPPAAWPARRPEDVDAGSTCVTTGSDGSEWGPVGEARTGREGVPRPRPPDEGHRSPSASPNVKPTSGSCIAGPSPARTIRDDRAAVLLPSRSTPAALRRGLGRPSQDRRPLGHRRHRHRHRLLACHGRRRAATRPRNPSPRPTTARPPRRCSSTWTRSSPPTPRSSPRRWEISASTCRTSSRRTPPPSRPSAPPTRRAPTPTARWRTRSC